MDKIELILVLGVIGASTAAFIWTALRSTGSASSPKYANDLLTQRAELDIENIFNDEFREELRNRGRLYFEKIIGENAMFLQQDLRLTTSQLNE